VTPPESSKSPPVMALFRGLRRRLRQTNPCTSCLFVVFFAAVLYLISAIRGNYFQSSHSIMTADGQRDEIGPGVADGRRLSALGGGNGGGAGQRRRRKNRVGSFVVGDDEVQLCKMTSRWASSAIDQQDYLHLPAESATSAAASKRQTGTNSCGADPLPTLFYVDTGGALVYNHTAAAGSKYDVMMDSCRAWKIEWNLDSGYVEKEVSMLTKIDADFVHVSCRLLRHRKVDRIDDERRATRTRPRSRGRRSNERHRTTSLLIANVAERRARQIHRDELRRHSPHFVGTAGLPDPFSHVIAEQNTSSSVAVEKHAKPNELRSRRDEQLPGSATHIVDEGEPAEHVEPIRKLDSQSFSHRSDRDLNQGDGRENDDTSTAVYHQWIAQIHPLSEVVKRERSDDVGKRHSDRMNVLVLALESVSSISFDRDLPKSRQFIVDQPHTVLFTGYNVIGDAAPANVISMLTGIGTLLRVIMHTLSKSKSKDTARASTPRT